MGDMYKILMIAPTPFFSDRGCHVQIYEQILSLQKLGHKVILSTYHNGKDMAGVDIRRIINIPWYKKTEAGPSCHKFYLDILLLIKSFNVARKMRPDIIHGHLHEGVAIGYALKKIFGIPLLFDLQGSLTAELKAHKFVKKNSLFYRMLYKSEKLIDNMADIVVTQSQDMLNQLHSEFGVKSAYLTLDGVDVEVFKPSKYNRNDVRKDLNLPLDKKIAAYLGILSPYQGVDCLIMAIPFVLRKYANAHFLIMGYPDVDKYRNMARSLKIEQSVTFTGRIDYKDTPKYLSAGDIAIGPKYGDTEADGKIYNYMACGLPVVASDTGVHREILADKAIYAKEGDHISLADGIVELLSDENRAKYLGQEARKMAEEHFTWDNVAEKLAYCYSLITKRRKGSE